MNFQVAFFSLGVNENAMLKKLISFILIMSLFSCTKDLKDLPVRNISESDFIGLGVTSKKYIFEEIINPSAIGLAGESVVISEAWRVPEEFPRMHLVNSSDWSYDKPKGKHGQGPLEMTDAADFLESKEPDSFWIYNMNLRKLMKFSIDENSLLAESEWKLSESMAMIHFVKVGSDSTYLAKPWDGLEILTEYDQKGNLKEKFGKWEPISERPDLNPKQVSELNNGWLDGNSDVGIFVRTGLHRDVMSIFHYQEKKFYTVYGPSKELPLFEVHETAGPSIFFSDESIYGYRDVVITKHFIFALYAGKSQKEFNQTGEMAEKIYVFDHKGKPIWKLDLDRSIINLVINEEKQEIYGLTTDEDPGISVFDFPEEMN